MPIEKFKRNKYKNNIFKLKEQIKWNLRQRQRERERERENMTNKK
jgi:hypothetical protein